MKDKYNFFDIMQNYKPADDLYTDNATKEDIERLKFLVYQKKGKSYGKLIVMKRLAIAAVVALALFGSAAGVNAATHGAIIRGIAKVFQIKTLKEDGTVTKQKITLDKNKNGNYIIEMPTEDDIFISIDENGNEKVSIKDKEDDDNQKVSIRYNRKNANTNKGNSNTFKIKQPAKNGSVDEQEITVKKNINGNYALEIINESAKDSKDTKKEN